MYFGLCLLVQTWLFGREATGEGKSPRRKKGREYSKQDMVREVTLVGMAEERSRGQLENKGDKGHFGQMI